MTLGFILRELQPITVSRVITIGSVCSLLVFIGLLILLDIPSYVPSSVTGLLIAGFALLISACAHILDSRTESGMK